MPGNELNVVDGVFSGKSAVILMFDGKHRLHIKKQAELHRSKAFNYTVYFIAHDERRIRQKRWERE